MALRRESRVGGTLCASLPWAGANNDVPGTRCEYPRVCAHDGVCWQAKRREAAGWEAHRRLHRHEVAAGRTRLSFAEWAGVENTLDALIDRVTEGLHAPMPALPFSGA